MQNLSVFRNRTPAMIGEHSIRHSAVMIPVLEMPDGLHLLFEVRSEKLEHQPGDICFPGGGMEEGETPEAAALRELTEELLVTSEQAEIIGPADVFAAGTRCVYPYVCLLRSYDFRFSEDEVAEVFTVPLSFFLENAPEIHKVVYRPEFREDFPFEKIHGGRNYGWRAQEDSILFYEYKGHVIWGMTAKIVQAFIAVLTGPEQKKTVAEKTVL